MENRCAIILAGGEGKRMKSQKPKALCPVLFTPMIRWVENALRGAGVGNLCVVKGFGAEYLDEYYKNSTVRTVLQSERLGTGHAVMQAINFLNEYKGGAVCVLCGDAPFVTSEALQSSYERMIEENASAAVITAELTNPFGYGRILRDKKGNLSRIVEQKDAMQEELSIREVNSGMIWFQVDDLLEQLPRLTNHNAQKEYYLTEVFTLLIQSGKKVILSPCEDPLIVLGANDRSQLYDMNELARKRVIKELMQQGVEFVCSENTIISPNVKIGRDTVILPGTILKGDTVIGDGCTIGPNSFLDNCIVGDYTELNTVQAAQSIIGNHVKIGPFCHVRPNSKIADKVKIGNFVEIKNSNIGQKTAVSHLTYVGDSDVGEGVNFGCGVVTVNYDGEHKNRCKVEDNAFIGCNTNLVAPVEIGEGAYTAAGSTITRDVPAGALAVARARQENKEHWAEKKLEKFKEKHKE